MNTTNLIGRLTKDPELKFLPDGKAVANFTLAINRPFKNTAGENEADFLLVNAWGKTAENVGNYLKKGSKAAVVGRIQTRNYTNDKNDKVYVTEIVADSVTFLDPKEQNSGQGQGQNQQNYQQQPQQPMATGYQPQQPITTNYQQPQQPMQNAYQQPQQQQMQTGYQQPQQPLQGYQQQQPMATGYLPPTGTGNDDLPF